MEIKLKLVSKAFLFIEDFSLSKSDGEVTLDLSSKDDIFIKTIITNIACGISESNVDWKEMISCIKDEDIRKSTYDQLGVEVDTSKFKDTIEAKAEILEAEIEESDEDETEEALPTEEEMPAVLEVPESALQDLLKGTTKSVAKKVKSANLSEEDKQALFALEEQGRNRATIKSLLS